MANIVFHEPPTRENFDEYFHAYHVAIPMRMYDVTANLIDFSLIATYRKRRDDENLMQTCPILGGRYLDECRGAQGTSGYFNLYENARRLHSYIKKLEDELENDQEVKPELIERIAGMKLLLQDELLRYIEYTRHEFGRDNYATVRATYANQDELPF